MRFLFAILILTGLPLSSATAEDISGLWDFRTDIEAKGCVITGRMVIGPAVSGDGERSCQFTSQEDCDWFDPDQMPLSMEQSCAVIEAGGMVLIRSRVDGSLTDWHPDVGNYMADEFDLDTIGPNRMTGDWFDRQWRAPVVFERPDGLPIG